MGIRDRSYVGTGCKGEPVMELPKMKQEDIDFVLRHVESAARPWVAHGSLASVREDTCSPHPAGAKEPCILL